MGNKEIAQQLRALQKEVRNNQLHCTIDSPNLIKLGYVIDHLDAAIDLLDIQEPWV